MLESGKKKKKCLLNLLYEKISHVVEDRRGQAPVKSAYFVKIIEMMPKFRKLASSRGLWSVQRLSEPSVSLVSLCLFLWQTKVVEPMKVRVCRARVSQEKQIHLGDDPTLSKTSVLGYHSQRTSYRSVKWRIFYPFLLVSRGDLDKLGFASR